MRVIGIKAFRDSRDGHIVEPELCSIRCVSHLIITFRDCAQADLDVTQVGHHGSHRGCLTKLQLAGVNERFRVARCVSTRKGVVCGWPPLNAHLQPITAGVETPHFASPGPVLSVPVCRVTPRLCKFPPVFTGSTEKRPPDQFILAFPQQPSPSPQVDRLRLVSYVSRKAEVRG